MKLADLLATTPAPTVESDESEYGGNRTTVRWSLPRAAAEVVIHPTGDPTYTVTIVGVCAIAGTSCDEAMWIALEAAGVKREWEIEPLSFADPVWPEEEPAP